MTVEGPWSNQLSSAAQRDIGRLPEKVAPAVAEFVTGPLAENPHRLSKGLTENLAGWRSARRGDYRVLLKIVADEHVVLVEHIDHRAHVYPPR